MKDEKVKRLQPNNINTNEYWDGLYSTDYYDYGHDDVKFSNLVNHIEDGSKVIEFGCGVGVMLYALSKLKPRCEVFGVDFSKDAISQVNKIGLYGIVADVSKPIKKTGYDYSLSFETLEHLDNPDGLVKNMADVLKKGGKAMLSTPYLDHIPSNEHVWEFDYDDVLGMFNKYFSKVWVYPWGSGRCVINTNGTIRYHAGNWDTIAVLAIK